MKTERNILIAFILNLAFSVFELVGGTVTGSVAIISDAVHDIGDALSIGASYFLERKSKKKPDEIYTYGYTRFSVLGSLVTTSVLIVGSIVVVYNSVVRIFNPVGIDYRGMILFAIIGVVVNLVAAWFTKEGDSLNQKAVNLHMIEDVLGWLVVLIGAIVMNFTELSVIDPIMSIVISVFIFVNAARNLKQVESVFLERIPEEINVAELKENICEIDGVLDVHHIHVWSMDGHNNCATMHVITDGDTCLIKKQIRNELSEHNIKHVTLETETLDEHCHEKTCSVSNLHSCGHHHHHH